MIHVLFFCSGVAALIYQVAWVRAFGTLFGNTLHSASIVTAVFMLGLGGGAYVAGRWADRHRGGRPGALLQTFGFAEAAIGTLALTVSLVLPRLGGIAAALSSYQQGADGWYTLSAASHTVKALLAAGLLTPITLLMGGTLTLLVRHVVDRNVDAAGWRIARLYAVNTAGAAAGCFLTDFALVPRIGLERTQVLAVGLNVAIAIGAVSAGARAAGTSATEDPAAAPPVLPPLESARPLWWTGLAIGLSGFAAMGLEILWFRYFTILLGEYRAVFSLLLTVILGGLGLGALLGGWLHQRTGRPAAAWITAQAAFVVCLMIGLLAVDAREIRDAAGPPLGLDGWARLWTEVFFNVRPMLLVVGIPSLLMGLAFPLANALVQRLEACVGHRAGALYLANTAGAVAGALVTGFVLLPAAGLQTTVTVLAAAAALVIPAVALAARAAPLQTAPLKTTAPARGNKARRPQTPPAREGRWAAGAAAVSTAAVLAWALLPPNRLLSQLLLFPLDRAYVVSEGLTEVVAVTDGPDGGRVLVTNGHPMSSTERFSQRYMRAMAHVPLLSMERPARVLVLCYGVGNTLHAASLHPSIRQIDMVDLSAHVLRHSSYFSDVNHDVLRDPRVTVYINDGRNHLVMPSTRPYDLITLEPPPIVHAGVASLYSEEFYRSARERLTPGGYVSQWLPVFGVSEAVVLSMVRAFVDVFPNAVLLSGAGTNLLLVGTRGAVNEIDPARLAAALDAAPAVRADLERLDLGTLREVAGMFVASARTLEAATRDATPISDDKPLLEYGRRSLMSFGDGGIPARLIAVSDVASWCPSCLVNGTPAPLVAGLDTYLELTELAYRAPQAASSPLGGGRTVAGSGYLGAIVPDSPELERLLRASGAANTGAGAGPGDDLTALRTTAERDPANGAARYALATALIEAGQYADAVDELGAALRLMPDSPEAYNNLGVALASLGRMNDALVAFERALALRPGFADARQNAARARAALGRP